MEEDLETNQLFVSGMPQDCTEEEIMQFFGWFGKISSVRLLKTGISRCKSFVVTPENKVVLYKILGTQNLVYRNRFLHVKPYESKRANLRSQLLDANTRRVILKKVPSQISEDRVRVLLEKYAGTIETIFAYRPETSDQDHLHLLRKFRTYSVLFTTTDAAERLLQLGHISLDEQFNNPIKIEKFSYRVRAALDPRRSLSHSSLMQEEADKNGNQMRVESCSEFGWTIHPNTSPYEAITSVHKETTNSTKPSPLTTCKHLKLQRIDINDNIHNVKPTSKKYFQMNKRFFCSHSESQVQTRLLPLKSQRPPS